MTDTSHHYDVASALWQGMRPYQEDSISTDFHAGLSGGFAIVADGMGGHAAGDIASNLAVVHASGHLKLTFQNMMNPRKLGTKLPDALGTAIDKANDAIAAHARQDSGVAGMGATMLAVLLVDDQLYWGSVGDSPLLLVRDGALQQLNQDHSMAPVIAAMVKRGEITAEQAKQHPDRNALTSVLMGERIEKTDLPSVSFKLQRDDILIAASDGLQFLENDAVLALIEEALPASSAEICDKLMGALKALGDPQQDNAAIVVVQPRKHGSVDAKSEPAQTSAARQTPERGPQTRILPDEETVDDAVDALDEGASKAGDPSTLIEDLGKEKIPDRAARSVSQSEKPPSSAFLFVLLVVVLAGAAALFFYFRSSL